MMGDLVKHFFSNMFNNRLMWLFLFSRTYSVHAIISPRQDQFVKIKTSSMTRARHYCHLMSDAEILPTTRQRVPKSITVYQSTPPSASRPMWTFLFGSGRRIRRQTSVRGDIRWRLMLSDYCQLSTECRPIIEDHTRCTESSQEKTRLSSVHRTNKRLKEPKIRILHLKYVARRA